MAYQSGRNLLIAYKEETTYGTLAGAADGIVLRINSGALSLAKEPIASGENRSDGMRTRGRHGARSVSGQYAADLSLGSFDDFIEAVFRGTYEAEHEITADTDGLTSITTTSSTIVASAGSWIDAGLRVGDVIRLSGHATAANNDRNLRIVELTASTITVAEELTADATPGTGFTVTRFKKLTMGTTARSFTLEEREADIDASEVFTGCRITGMSLTMEANGMVALTFSLAGQDMQVVEGADSPYFTDPARTTTLGLTAVEAVIRLGDADLLDVTSLELSIDLNATTGQAVVGSTIAPDVFTNLARVEGSITALTQDLDRVSDFLDETQLSLHLLLTENGDEPKEFAAFYLGNLTMLGSNKSELGTDGPRTRTFPLMVGIDDAGGARDRTMVKFITSTAGGLPTLLEGEALVVDDDGAYLLDADGGYLITSAA